MHLFTIGHSAHSIEKFVALLKRHEITLVADVRALPTSRFHPQFRKQRLANTLTCEEIGYVFLGRTLGGRPTDSSCYADGRLPEKGTKPWPKPIFSIMMHRSWFVEGIEQLLKNAQNGRTAVMCSEENPAQCHRHLLIAKYLLRHYGSTITLLHIRGNGRLECATAIHTPISKQMPLFVVSGK